MSQKSFHYRMVHEERRLWAFDRPGQSSQCKRISRRWQRHHDKQKFLESLEDGQEEYLYGEHLTALLTSQMQDIEEKSWEGISAVMESVEKSELEFDLQEYRESLDMDRFFGPYRDETGDDPRSYSRF